MDVGNDYTRYTIPRLVQMYLQRRWNLLQIVLKPPYDRMGDRPLVLYALHMQPESSIDVFGSYFADQVVLIEQIARSLPATHDLYVKAHPDDVDGRPLSFYRRLKTIPGVKIIDPRMDSRPLMRTCDLVFTVSGTIAYEAGLLQIPAITFARNFFQRPPDGPLLRLPQAVAAARLTRCWRAL